MNYKKTHEIKVRTSENISPKEARALRAHLVKRAKVVKAPKDIYLEGKEAIDSKPRYKEVKGDNNEYINRNW